MNDIVAVVAFNKGTKYISTVTSCDKREANKYANYYRKVGYLARVISYDKLDKFQKYEEQERRMIV